MSDLVERLKALGLSGKGNSQTAYAAATEIEQLRAEVAKLRAALEEIVECEAGYATRIARAALNEETK